jgi:hypothetical protein
MELWGNLKTENFPVGESDLEGDKRIKKEVTSAKWLCFADQSQGTERLSRLLSLQELMIQHMHYSVHLAFILLPYLAAAPFVLAIYFYQVGARRAEEAQMSSSSRLVTPVKEDGGENVFNVQLEIICGFHIL